MVRDRWNIVSQTHLTHTRMNLACLSPEKRLRKIPEKFRDQEEVPLETSLSLHTDGDEKSGAQTVAPRSEEPPVKRRRGRPPKIRTDQANSSVEADRGIQVQQGAGGVRV